MKTAFVVAGAAVLVAGAALIAFSPFYVNTGFYRAELKQIQSAYNSSANPSIVFTTYTSYADTGELIALAGVILAPLGAALLGYGISAAKTEEKLKQPTSEEPMQA